VIQKHTLKILRWLLAWGALVYVGWKLYEARQQLSWSGDWLPDLLPLAIALFLVPVNWGLEGYKWKILVERTKPSTVPFSWIKPMLIGVAVSIFTPNRVGELPGRLIILPRQQRVAAGISAVIGSWAQLTLTLTLGLLSALPWLSYLALPTFTYILLSLAAILSVVAYFSLPFWWKKGIPARWQSRFAGFARTLERANLPLLTVAMSWSLVRYGVFLSQFLLVLIAFHVHIPFFAGASLVSLGYLISTFIPRIAFSEIAARGSSMVLTLSWVGAPAVPVMLATTVIWILNVGLVALPGAFMMLLDRDKTPQS
jgi:hypothetical protein